MTNLLGRQWVAIVEKYAESVDWWKKDKNFHNECYFIDQEIIRSGGVNENW